MNTKIYEPVGQCIYCGSKENLQDEHIIAFGLHGNMILPKSSCKECAGITSFLERKILRGPLLPVRAAAKFKTRRPRNRPSTFPMKVIQQGQEHLRNVPIEDHLTLLVLPLLPPPAYADERPYTMGIEIIGRETILFGDEPAEIMRRFNAEGLSVSMNYQYVEFVRMIGKIAYAFTVAQFGLSAIAEPYVLPAIMGQRDDIGKWVGSSDFVYEAEKQGAIHTIVTNFLEWQGEKLLVANVKLFANAHPHGYNVIVGRAI